MSASRWIGARLRCASATMCDDPGEHGVGADLLGAHDEAAGAVDRAADQPVAPGSFSTGIDSPVTIDFVDRAAAFEHDAVDRHAVARAHAQAIADMHLVERHFLVVAVVA